MPDLLKPIKRSVYLAPLSREHHESLLLGWKIRSGIKKNISSDRILLYCLWFWKNHLQKHFNDEEKGFVQILGSDHTLFLLMVKDHKKIKKLLTSMAEKKKDNYTGLEEFTDALTTHIRFEERVLFKYIQQTASHEQLEAFAKMHTTHTLPEWQDEFWVN
ncbi:MAG: hemerythrin domain-containing protein [Ferruginibacter sp.]